MEFPLNDAGNVRLVVKYFGDKLRYDHSQKAWYVWAGHWWQLDGTGEAGNIVQQCIEQYRIPEANAEEDKSIQVAIRKWINRSLNSSGVASTLERLKSHPEIATTVDKWNSDPYMIGVRNGVVDLRTGKLSEGQPSDLVTQHVDAIYSEWAMCPRWQKFLNEIFDGDDEYIEYVQRAIGYSLTGDISEQCFFLAHGSGSNGKSTFLEAIHHVFGSYAKATAFSTFSYREKSAIPNDVADLVGSRFVTSSETDENDQLNESRLKALTGGEVIKARHLFKDLFEFRPTFKIWLSVNHLPKVRDDSDGIWRRMHTIHFPRQWKSDDPSLDRYLWRKLHAESAGILKWAIEGCRKWQESGLKVPQRVIADTQAYRQENDALSEFLDDCCVVEPTANSLVSDLWKTYSNWCEENREKPLIRKTFNRLLGHKKIVQTRSKDGKQRIWAGISVHGKSPLLQETIQ